MDLVARGVITSKFISITGELVELNELFTDYWRSIVPVTQTSSIAFPFSRLDTEPFWKLAPLPGKEITRPIIDSINTVTQLRNHALGAEIDEELFVLIATADGRDALAAALFRSCFSAQGQQALLEQSKTHSEAYQYSLTLEKIAQAPIAAQSIAADEYKPAARDQGFRRAIVLHYDHRCALCGTRIVTSEGHTVVDAAHIMPWSESHNDDIRNGMALCKLCHWAFDEWLMGVSDAYRVLIATQVSFDHNAAGALLNLKDRNIIAPKHETFRPHQNNLAKHRERFRL